MSAIEEALPERLGAIRRAKSQAIFGMLTGSLQLARLQSDKDIRTQILSAATEAAFELARSAND